MSHHSPPLLLLHIILLLLFSLLPALSSLPVLPNPNPNPNPNPSQPITIPSFPEQSALSGCPLHLPDPLFPAVKSSCTGQHPGQLPNRAQCCPVLASESYLSRLFSLQSIASLSGCCQVAVPLGNHKNLPVSVSLIAGPGCDRFLLDTLKNMYSSLQEQGDVVSVSNSTSNVISKETSADIAKEKGNQAFKEKQWPKAISFYTEAIKLNGNNATYYSNRAAVYLELNSFVQAEDDCTKAINLDKKNVKAYLRRGTAREMLGYYKEAIEDFRYALVLEPTNKRAAVTVERLKNLFQ